MLAAEVTADKGEKEIGSDAESMYAFSAFAAASAATKWFVKEYLKNMLIRLITYLRWQNKLLDSIHLFS